MTPTLGDIPRYHYRWQWHRGLPTYRLSEAQRKPRSYTQQPHSIGQPTSYRTANIIPDSHIPSNSQHHISTIQSLAITLRHIEYRTCHFLPDTGHGIANIPIIWDSQILSTIPHHIQKIPLYIYQPGNISDTAHHIQHGTSNTARPIEHLAPYRPFHIIWYLDPIDRPTDHRNLIVSKPDRIEYPTHFDDSS